MKVRIIKKDDKCYVQLPQELMQNEEVEIFSLRDGYYLLSVSLQNAPQTLAGKQTDEFKKQETGSTLTEEEREILKKLTSVKFENRTPAHVAKNFSEKEKQVLTNMEKKGYLNVFRGGKYKETGVYSISDRIFQLMNEPQKPASSTSNPSELRELFKKGHMILEGTQQAYQISEILRKERKNNDVFGVKGFDNKYYIVTREYFTEMVFKIKNTLKGEMTTSAIAKACKTEEQGCRAVLLLMAEKGDALEKKKDVFVLI